MKSRASKQPQGIATRLTSAGRNSAAAGRAVNPPVTRASTFLFDTLDDFEAAANAPFDGPFYGRLGTPTTFAFEEAMAEMEGGYRSVATASGLSAIAATLIATLSNGDHALVVDSVYDPVRRFCSRILARMGVEVSYYEATIGEEIGELIRPNTRLVYLEAPGSGTFEMQDVAAVAAAAKARGVVTAMDSTWSTPLYFRPLEHGIDLSIHSATKYITGHSDAMLGVVTATRDSFPSLRRAAQDLGACAGSEECNLGLRGLRTLQVRLPRHQETGLTLARWLTNRPEVVRVLHPGLPDDPGHALWKRDFEGASGLFAIELAPLGREQLAALVERMSLFSIGFSWGGYESLILPMHPEKSRTVKPWTGGSLLRIHAGLEDPSDLIDDLDAAFSTFAHH